MAAFNDITTRPYRCEEILSRSIRGVFGRHFWSFYLPVLLALFLTLAIYALLREPIAGSFGQIGALGDLESSDAEITIDPSFWAHTSQFMLLAGIVALIHLLFMQYILLRMKQVIFDEHVTAGETLLRCADPPGVLSLIVTAFLGFALFLIGYMMCLLPGLALTFVLALLPACVVFSEHRFRVPIDQPFRLLRGRIGKTVGVLLILFVAIGIVSFVGSIPLVVEQMPMLEEMDAEGNPFAMWEDYYAMALSPKMLLFQALGGGVIGVLYLVLGFATVVMYFNYTMAPRTNHISASVARGN